MTRRRAGGRPRRRSRRSPRASATASIPPTTAVFGEVGLGRRGARHRAGAAARPRGRADGIHPLHHARGEHRSRRTDAQLRRLRAGRRPDGRRGARRAAEPDVALRDQLADIVSVEARAAGSFHRLHRAAQFIRGGLPMAWFALARVLFVVAVAYAAALLQPLAGRRRRSNVALRRSRSRRSSSSSKAACARPPSRACSAR